MSDLLTAASKEDEIARTARGRNPVARSLERPTSRTSAVFCELSKNPNGGTGQPPEAASAYS